LLLALSYQQLNKMDLASHYLDLAKRRSPNNPEVQRSLAGYYRDMGKYSEAIAALKSIHNPKPDMVAELAYTYQLDGKLDNSAKLYAEAANAVPKDMGLQLSAAQAAVGAGSIEDADPFLKRAEALDPNYYRLHAIRGEIAQLQERGTDAVQEYKAALANLPQSPVEGSLYGIQLHMDLVALYQNLDDESAVHNELQIAQNEINALDGAGPGRGQFLRLRSLIRLDSGNLDGALSDVKDALALDPHDPNNLQLNGDILMKLGRTDDAIAVYKRVLAIDPVNRFALTSLGYASRAKGRDRDAEKYFERLAQVDPGLYVPYLALGDLYTARREFTRAEASYAKGFALAPRNPLIVAGGMNAAVEAHDLKLGGVWLTRVTAGMQHEPHVLREKERYLSFEGKYQESAAAGQEAIKALPRDRDVVVYLGYDLLHLQKYDELLNLTSQYLTVLPKEPDIPLLQGYVYKHQGLDDKARDDFSEVLARDPNVVTAYVNRGYMYNDLHQPQLAAADFESAIKREPKDGEAHLGLAYAQLDLHKPMAALRESEIAERTLGDSRDVHVIRATAYGRADMLTKAATEYRAALKFTPDDGALHLGLGNTLFAERRYHDAIGELETAERLSPNDATVYALLARSFANLHDRDQTLHYVKLAEAHARPSRDEASNAERSEILISTGQALSTLGEQPAAMERFSAALEMPNSDRVAVRLAIAQLMAQQDHVDEAERQVGLALMEAEAGDTKPPDGNQFIMASNVFSSVHDYQLSQNYLERARVAGAPEAKVQIALANDYLALGDTSKAQAALSSMTPAADDAPDYPYLLAKANVFRQKHENAQALTSFAQASNAGGEDQSAQQGMLQAGADEGLRITPSVSALGDFSMQPIFEDTTVYVLDSQLDSLFPVSKSQTALLPPPRSSIETEGTGAFHLHLGQVPTGSGFFQVRNARGQISVPSTSAIVNRNTTDYTLNFGLNPTIHLGNNVLTLNSGIQGTIRRDSLSPAQMNQNLFRVFTYLSTSSFFNAVSVSGYILRETGPFTETNLNSRQITAALDFRIGAPWGKTALVTGWGANDQLFKPVNNEDYYTSSYIGIEHRFSERLSLRAIAEDLRAWRIVGSRWADAQDLRPAGTVNFSPNPNWDFQFSSAFSSTRSFHLYDAMQNGFSVSYARPFRRGFVDDSGKVILQYPIRFSAGLQDETFFNFPGNHSQQLRPYVQINIF
jgi:tetratricopeptide (TPR) repeat protein